MKTKFLNSTVLCERVVINMNPILDLPRPEIIFNDEIHRDKFIWENRFHEGWFAFIVLSGSFEVTMREKKDIASEGDIVIFPSDEKFSRHILKPITILYINFRWRGEMSGGLWQEYSPCGKLEFLDPTRVNEDIKVLRSLSNLAAPEALGIANHYFCDIWYDYCKLRTTDSILDYNKITDPVVGRAIRMINAGYASPIRISELAGSFNMSHINFTNRFIRATGMRPVEYLRRTRLNSARMLLISTDLPISETAQRCGFENRFYFSRCFREFYGVSPSEYRDGSRI